MSRALDKDTKEALKLGDFRETFEAISLALLSKHEELLEIELLGKSHSHDFHNQPLIQDGNALAFTKIDLLRAFLVSRRIFIQSIGDLRNADLDQVRRATAVMLLFDPEHLTAANTRKRVLLLLTQAAGKEPEKDNQSHHELLLKEKYFVDSLLTSRLHRHTKSPVLWDHRRWLLAQLQAHKIPLDISHEFTKVIFTSGERHPRNYYAWMHARDMVRRDTSTQASADGDVVGGFLVEETRKQCFAHHNDVSRWMFLLFLVERWPGELNGVAEETLKIVERFGWRNESVWYFLRNLVALPRGEGRAWKGEVVRVARGLTKGVIGVKDGSSEGEVGDVLRGIIQGDGETKGDLRGQGTKGS